MWLSELDSTWKNLGDQDIFLESIYLAYFEDIVNMCVTDVLSDLREE